jgi:hypothetical protein
MKEFSHLPHMLPSWPHLGVQCPSAPMGLLPQSLGTLPAQWQDFFVLHIVQKLVGTGFEAELTSGFISRRLSRTLGSILCSFHLWSSRTEPSAWHLLEA